MADSSWLVGPLPACLPVLPWLLAALVVAVLQQGKPLSQPKAEEYLAMVHAAMRSDARRQRS